MLPTCVEPELCPSSNLPQLDHRLALSGQRSQLPLLKRPCRYSWRLPGDSSAAGDRRDAAAHRGMPRRPQNHPPLPAAVRRGVRGQRPGGGRPGGVRCRLAGAGHRARTVTTPLPRYTNLTAPAPFAARWRQQAACHGTDLNQFYPERGQSAGPARQVCARCPVRQPCLEYALSNRITHGIWGGLTRAGTLPAPVPVGAGRAAGTRPGDRGH